MIVSVWLTFFVRRWKNFEEYYMYPVQINGWQVSSQAMSSSDWDLAFTWYSPDVHLNLTWLSSELPLKTLSGLDWGGWPPRFSCQPQSPFGVLGTRASSGDPDPELNIFDYMKDFTFKVVFILPIVRFRDSPLTLSPDSRTKFVSGSLWGGSEQKTMIGVFISPSCNTSVFFTRVAFKL